MHNCLVLGSGRSGTSMVGGCLESAGYWMGDDLLPPTPGNPKGYFESRVIQNINEDLLTQVEPRRPWGPIGRLFPARMGKAQRWLAQVPLGMELSCPTNVRDRVLSQLEHQPFAFKDPRFCYTLPVWRPFLPPTRFVCVFRHPGVTAASILRECQTEAYLASLNIDLEGALTVWRLMYEHVLKEHRMEGEWLCVHYEQILRGDGLDRLECFLDVRLDREFPDPALKRSAFHDTLSRETLRAYHELCEWAEFDPE
ncbi:MAG: sulfotransferase [Phycisphaerae bacterium]|jgi:hypothetical protein